MRDEAGEMCDGFMFPNVKRHSNSHTRITNCLRRAGLEVWREFFNALRSSRVRELRRISPALEAELIGHSEQIASLHYDAAIDDDYAQIRGSFATLSVQESVQQDAAPRSKEAPKNQPQKETVGIPVGALLCDSLQIAQVPPRGVEPLLPD